jgi:IS5 family transposase
MGAGLSVCSGCCGFISCSSGSTCPVRQSGYLVEDALHDWLTMRNFVSIDLGREPVPDETTVCKFRHLLKRHSLGKQMLTLVNGYLARHSLEIGTGTIVDATILAAPSSTRNKDKKRDPEMHQVKKATSGTSA